MVTSVTVESFIPGHDVDFVIKEEDQDDAFEMSGYEDDLEPISPQMEPNDDVDTEADGFERNIISVDVSFVSVVEENNVFGILDETNDSEQREDNNNNTNDSEQREVNWLDQDCSGLADMLQICDASQQSSWLSSAGTDAGAVATPPPPSPPPSDEPCNVEARGRCRRRGSANTAEESSPRASASRATTRKQKKDRRTEINHRERMRMHELNQYYLDLCQVLPFGERNLTKKETLQRAVSYIKALENAISVMITNKVHFKFTPAGNSNSCNARKLANKILSNNPNVSEQDRLNNRRALGFTSSDSDSD